MIRLPRNSKGKYDMFDVLTAAEQQFIQLSFWPSFVPRPYIDRYLHEGELKVTAMAAGMKIELIFHAARNNDNKYYFEYFVSLHTQTFTTPAEANAFMLTCSTMLEAGALCHAWLTTIAKDIDYSDTYMADVGAPLASGLSRSGSSGE